MHVVDFYADWCKPCKMMEPIIHEVEAELNIPFEKVDIENHPEMQQQYSIMSIPTFVFLEGEKEVGRIVGYQDKAKFLKFVEEIQKYK